MQRIGRAEERDLRRLHRGGEMHRRGVDRRQQAARF